VKREADASSFFLKKKPDSVLLKVEMDSVLLKVEDGYAFIV